MGPRSRRVGLEWRPGPPFGVAKRLHNPMDVVNLWFGSESGWRRATGPTRGATRGFLGVVGRSVPHREGSAPPGSPGDGCDFLVRAEVAQEAYAAFWATDLWACMGPRSRQVGLEWRPGPPLGVAERVQNPMDFSEFVVWERADMAPSDKADKKSNTRALECCGSIGATPGGLRADRLPRGQLRFPRSRGSGPERPTPRSEQLTFARLWARGAAGLASSGVRAHPSGSQKAT